MRSAPDASGQIERARHGSVGKGGGMSDMFGGGVTTSVGGSSVAERNLDRITVAVALIWAASIVGLGLLVAGT